MIVIIFILTDDTTITSINYIQNAHKRADKGFNDIVAQLYQQEFKTQEKAKYEHMRQAKEKALEKQAEVDRIAREHDEETERSNNRGSQHVSEKDEMTPNIATALNRGYKVLGYEIKTLNEKEVKKIKYKEISKQL